MVNFAAQTAENMPLMLSAKDVQKLGFSRPRAYEFLNREDMPVVVVGGRKYLHRDLFLGWLEQQAIGNKGADDEQN